MKRRNSIVLVVLTLLTNGLYGFVWLFNNLPVEAPSQSMAFIIRSKRLIVGCWTIYVLCLLVLFAIEGNIEDSGDIGVVKDVIVACGLLVGLFLFGFLLFGLVQLTDYLREVVGLEMPSTTKVVITYVIFYWAFYLVQEAINAGVANHKVS